MIGYYESRETNGPSGVDSPSVMQERNNSRKHDKKNWGLDEM